MLTCSRVVSQLLSLATSLLASWAYEQRSCDTRDGGYAQLSITVSPYQGQNGTTTVELVIC